MKSKSNAVTGKMQLPRALELINAIIDHMINDEGGHSRRVIETLLNIGFTAEELIEDFCFPSSDVNDVVEESEAGGNDQTE